MKYLKTYEDIENKYEFGDYVAVNPLYFKNIYFDVPQKWLPFDFPIGEIITDGAIQYYTGFISHVHEIIRKATSEEIEEFKMRKDLKKYNL